MNKEIIKQVRALIREIRIRAINRGHFTPVERVTLCAYKHFIQYERKGEY